MGAVSLLMSSKCNIMVVDSPFSCLKQLCYDTAKKFKYAPNCLIFCCFNLVYYCLKKDIEDKTNVDIN